MGYIYKITNDVNNKFYIGKTVKTVEERLAQHFKKSQHFDNRHLYNAMNKYEKEHFHIEIIEECQNKDLNNREKYWIALLDAQNPNIAYNETAGGDGGDVWTNNSHKNYTSEQIRKGILKENYIQITKEMLQQDLQNNLTMQDITKKYHASKFYLNGLFKRFFGKTLGELKNNISFSGKQEDIAIINPDELLLKVQEGLYIDEIAEYFHVSRYIIYHRCQKYFHKTLTEIRGYDLPKRRYSLSEEGKNKKAIAMKKLSGENNPNYKHVDKDILYQMLCDNKSNEEIATFFNVSKATIISKCKLYFNKTPKEVKQDAQQTRNS